MTEVEARGVVADAMAYASVHGAWDDGLEQRFRAGQGDARLDAAARALSDWRLRPTGTEGYRTAEVTLGGVDTGGLHSRTMEARGVPGLFFIGECVDVTGWLGGYNFQWAWSSADAAARAIRGRAAP